MTDRDHFAAAALTGLLSNVQKYQKGPLVEQAFEIADFMLFEREASQNKAETLSSVTRACSTLADDPLARFALTAEEAATLRSLLERLK